MLEIIFIWRLVNSIGKTAQAKGYKKFGFQIMAALLWISFEVVGIVFADHFLHQSISPLISYVFGFIGALIGAGLAFLIINKIPSAKIESTPTTSIKVAKFLPLVASILAVSCICLTFVFAVGSQVRYIASVKVTKPIIGVELDGNGFVVKGEKVFTGSPEKTFLDFYLDGVENADIPITIVMYINGELAVKIEKVLKPGHIVIVIDSYYPPGDFRVDILFKEKILNSVFFAVK